MTTTPMPESYVLDLNTILEHVRGFGTTRENARWYYRAAFSPEAAAEDITNGYYAPDHNPDI